MTTAFQFHTDNVSIELNGDSVTVDVTNVNLSDLTGQVSVKELLDCLEFSDIAEYYMEAMKEVDESITE